MYIRVVDVSKKTDIIVRHVVYNKIRLINTLNLAVLSVILISQSRFNYYPRAYFENQRFIGVAVNASKVHLEIGLNFKQVIGPDE